MAKHTEGPWHVMDTPATREIFNDCPVIVSEHVEDAIIATIGEDVAGSEANGHLLAAAPDLLAACRAALEDVREITGATGIKAPSDPLLVAAIAKAEGRTC